MPLRAVLVLYRRALADSESFQSLSAALTRAGIAAEDFELLVYDNGPVPQAVPAWQHRLRYVHDAANGGLVAAYNRALELAVEEGSEWILLLDQDSHLPEDYFEQFGNARRWIESRTVAVVPKVRSGGRMVSPSRVVLGVPNLAPLPDDVSGLYDREVAAINAGAFVRTSFLRELGGYPRSYWLDGIDLWFCAMAYRRGRNMFIMPTWLEHKLSVASVKDIDPARWASILGSEVQCCLDTRGPMTRVLQSGIMLRRAIELFQQRAPAHAWPTVRHAARLLAQAARRPGPQRV